MDRHAAVSVCKLLLTGFSLVKGTTSGKYMYNYYYYIYPSQYNPVYTCWTTIIGCRLNQLWKVLVSTWINDLNIFHLEKLKIWLDLLLISNWSMPVITYSSFSLVKSISTAALKLLLVQHFSLQSWQNLG